MLRVIPPTYPNPRTRRDIGRVYVPCPGGQREHRIDWAFPRRDIRPGHEGRSATTGVADELVGRLLRLAAGRRILRKERSFCGSFDVNFCPSADSSAPPIPSRRARLRLTSGVSSRVELRVRPSRSPPSAIAPKSTSAVPMVCPPNVLARRLCLAFSPGRDMGLSRPIIRCNRNPRAMPTIPGSGGGRVSHLPGVISAGAQD